LQRETHALKQFATAAAKSGTKSALRGLPLTARRRILYGLNQRKWLRLNPPRTFNEKVNWRIINDRRSLIGSTCDKLKAKEYAVGLGVRAPQTIWSGVDLSELTSLSLPEHWVLKPNHRTGIVHMGRGRPDVDELRRSTRGWLDEKGWSGLGEWAYSQARRCYVLENRLGDPAQDLPDYKFFVFGGRVEMIQLDTDRHTNHRRRLYTRDWTPLDVVLNYPMAPIHPEPRTLESMVTTAEKLGTGFDDFIRVDLYEYDDTVYFGELTPYPGGGKERFSSNDLNVHLGELWSLPQLREA
jgi:hypothetical protein